ncbi:MAG: hypothetical protein AAB490_03190 [Patescibacteria group bacterium]
MSRIYDSFLKVSSAVFEHRLAIMLAVCVGILVFAPQYLSRLALGPAYQGVPFLYLDNELNYLARIQDIVRGDWLGDDSVFYEYSDESILPPIGEYFYAIPSLLLRGSPVTIVIASKFLFPAALFLLIYAVMIQLTGSPRAFKAKITAIAVALLSTLGYGLIDLRSAIATFSGQLHATDLNIWTRPVNPIIGALLFFAFLVALWRLHAGRGMWARIWAGIVLGLSITYFFSWALSLTFLIVVTISYALRKQAKRIVDHIIVFGISVLVQLPFWINAVMHFGNGDDSLARRNGLLLLHAPMMNKVLLVGTLFFVCVTLYQYVREKKLGDWWWFSVSLLAACWVVFNQQILTGRTVWPDHFVQFSIPVVIIVTYVILYRYILPRSVALWIIPVALAIAGSLTAGIFSASSYRYSMDDYRKQQNDAPFIRWANESTAEQCVILAYEKGYYLSYLIPAFTHCKVYSSYDAYSGVPRERIIHNMLVLLRLRQIQPANVKSFLESNVSREINTYLFEDWIQIFETEVTPQSRAKIEMVADAYAEFYTEDFATAIRKYKLDYIVSEEPLAGVLVDELQLDEGRQYGRVIVYPLL